MIIKKTLALGFITSTMLMCFGNMAYASDFPPAPPGLQVYKTYSSLPHYGLQCYQQGKLIKDIGDIDYIAEYSDPQTGRLRHIEYKISVYEWNSVDVSDDTTCEVNEQH